MVTASFLSISSLATPSTYILAGTVFRTLAQTPICYFNVRRVHRATIRPMFLFIHVARRVIGGFGFHFKHTFSILTSISFSLRLI